jgi:hypothetical protein
MKPPADFLPFLVDASWFNAYWYSLPSDGPSSGAAGVPGLATYLRSLHTVDWRRLADTAVNENALGYL